MGIGIVARTARGNHVWRDDTGPLIYVSGLAVDGDGSPHCYHLNNQGLDYLANARDGNRWVGVVTRNNVPVVQGKDDPAPGYCVSPTSLADATLSDPGNPRRYVDSETIPFIAFPSKLYDGTGGNTDVKRLALGVNLGDYVIVYDTKTGKYCGAIFADVGPSYKLGEASIRVAKELGINPSPKSGGVDHTLRIAYLVFPTTYQRWQASPWPQTPEQVMQRAQTLFEEWGKEAGGGPAQLKSTLQDIQDRSLSFGDEDDDPTIDVPEPGARFKELELQYREAPIVE